MLITWSTFINQYLHTSSIRHRTSAYYKCRRDSGDGSKGYFPFCQERIEALDYGTEDHASYAREDLNHVVWDVVEVHLAGLGDEVVEDLVYAEVED